MLVRSCCFGILFWLKSASSFSLAWDPLREGALGASGPDNGIYQWQVREASVVQLSCVRDPQQQQINDLHFHPTECIIAAAGEEKRFTLFDSRSHKVIESIEAHEKGVNSIEFHPQNANLFLTGSDDTNIALWDRRMTQRALHRFTDHCASIFEVHWNPVSPSIFASSADNKVFVSRFSIICSFLRFFSYGTLHVLELRWAKMTSI